ncbi:hypothetical protein JCM14713_25250 [Desulfomicrobium salsuginis]
MVRKAGTAWGLDLSTRIAFSVIFTANSLANETLTVTGRRGRVPAGIARTDADAWPDWPD